MIRFFEVLGLDDEPEYFGFMDTGTDRILEFEGEQFFLDYRDFEDRVPMHQFQRLLFLLPEHWRSV